MVGVPEVGEAAEDRRRSVADGRRPSRLLPQTQRQQGEGGIRSTPPTMRATLNAPSVKKRNRAPETSGRRCVAKGVSGTRRRVITKARAGSPKGNDEQPSPREPSNQCSTEEWPQGGDCRHQPKNWPTARLRSSGGFSRDTRASPAVSSIAAPAPWDEPPDDEKTYRRGKCTADCAGREEHDPTGEHTPMPDNVADRTGYQDAGRHT
jgi:hypothetical protein